MQIALDGPAASGKSTAARLAAKELNFLYIDTGAMYRAATLKSIRDGVDFKKDEEIYESAGKMKLDMIQDWSIDRGYRVFIDGEDVTEELFMPHVDRLVSVTARIPGVRKLMVELQRELAGNQNVIMAGRDIGTRVLPHAELKIFLIAEPVIRAERRYHELLEKGEKKDFNHILENIRERDLIDSTRAESPLSRPEDAVDIDSSHLSIEQMVGEIIKLAREKMK